MLTFATRTTFTVDEAADLLGIHRQTLYAAIRRGEIPAVRIGRRVLVSRHVLEELLRTGSSRPPQFEDAS